MPEIVAQWYEAGNWCVQYRMWQYREVAVEPTVCIPAEVWFKADEKRQTALVEAGTAFHSLLQGDLHPSADAAPEAPKPASVAETETNLGG